MVVILSINAGASMTKRQFTNKNSINQFRSKLHHSVADGTGVFFCFFVFFWYILLILSFGCATIVNREIKSVSAI